LNPSIIIKSFAIANILQNGFCRQIDKHLSSDEG
jgi:hypothetical protein